MATNTVYLITGANRGIGQQLTSTLLVRPHTTVIATVRNPSTSSHLLTRLEVGEGSRLVVAGLEVSGVRTGDIETATKTLYASLKEKEGVKKIDVLVANAGFCSPKDFLSVTSTPLENMAASFHINAIGPVALFQALRPLLMESENAKFIVISSSLGSIAHMEGPVPSAAYGMAKAAVNYAVRKVHFEEASITAMALHPGWVKTDNGQTFADAVGAREPPMTLERSVEGVLKQIDGATKEGTSGGFVSYDGQVIAF
ncbi:hypothetical protein BJ875DRAFT_452828 [Amylocarpus encephaloides]|uniref:Uncharacterized protein n=1 Tax=Amylocarpus encephaloides TaxID=45428 RepID=A0A9P7YPX6_9HELO|nr:hypothetical protein BJ875DRAFT_452828 [Amylocarpus encephaloides]